MTWRPAILPSYLRPMRRRYTLPPDGARVRAAAFGAGTFGGAAPLRSRLRSSEYVRIGNVYDGSGCWYPDNNRDSRYDDDDMGGGF